MKSLQNEKATVYKTNDSWQKQEKCTFTNENKRNIVRTYM